MPRKPKRNTRPAILIALLTFLAMGTLPAPVAHADFAPPTDLCLAAVQATAVLWGPYGGPTPKDVVHEGLAKMYTACDGWGRFGKAVNMGNVPFIPVDMSAWSTTNTLTGLDGCDKICMHDEGSLLGADFYGTLCNSGNRVCARYMWFGACKIDAPQQWDFTAEFP